MNLKYIFIVFFAVSILIANTVKASDLVPSFNTNINENEFLVGQNLTKGTGWSDPVYADADELVEVAVYYHNNTVDSVAKNTSIRIELPSRKGTDHVIKGYLKADNATEVSGSIYDGKEIGKPNLSIISNGSTELKFVSGSVRWYPNAETNKNPASLPGGQTGDEIITSGINIGDVIGCFQYAGFVKFQVRLVGESVSLTNLHITKDVKKIVDDRYVDRITVNPGNEFEYRIVIRNLDGMTPAKNLRVKDVLPDGIVYVGPAIMKVNGGQGIQIQEGLTTGGIVVLPELKASEYVEIFFRARSLDTVANEACLVNRAYSSSTTALKEVDDTATVCFVAIKPTPTPTVSPTPTQPENPVPVTPNLPSTGPELNILASLGLAGLGGSLSRFYSLKRSLRKKSRNMKIV